MSALTPQPTPTSPDAELPTQVAMLSRVFARLFGARWREQGSDPKTLQTWERAFALNGLTPAQLQRGLQACTTLAWPPTCGEFIALCFDPVPDLHEAIAEAAAWARNLEHHDGTWSHPAVGAAARKVGDYAIRHLDERTLQRRFEREYTRAIEAHRRGEQLDVPARRLAHDTSPRPQGPEQLARAKAHIDEIRQLLGARPA